MQTDKDNALDSVYISLGVNAPNVQHDHSYTSHKTQSATARRKLIQASCICATFMMIELIAGYVAHSLALLTDALHLVSDLSSFLISLFALWLSSLQGTHQLSFGYHRAEILGALVSVVAIWLCSGVLLYEGVKRIMNPTAVNGRIMLITAFFGTIANLIMTAVLGSESHLHHHHHHGHCHATAGDSHTEVHSNQPAELSSRGTERAKYSDETTKAIATDLQQALLIPSTKPESPETVVEEAYPHTIQNVNLRAAYIHALGDLIQNIGVLIAALVIYIRPSYSIVDPICTVIFSILVCMTTLSILSDATNVLMEGVPRELDIHGLREDLNCISNVVDVHDLHVWSLSVGKPSLACHMVIDSDAHAREVLHVATQICQKKYNILHTTIQVDFSTNKQSCDTGAHAKCH